MPLDYYDARPQVAMGLLTTAQADVIRSTYTEILRYHERQDSGPSRTVAAQKLARVLRKCPEAGSPLLGRCLRRCRMSTRLSHSPRTRFTPATIFASFSRAIQRAVWLSPQSGASDNRSAGA